jgi:hypothetical protein
LFLIGGPKEKTRNARNFANVGRIEWKERHTIYQINPRLFRHVIKKIWIQFQEDMIGIFIIRLNYICIPYTIINYIP